MDLVRREVEFLQQVAVGQMEIAFRVIGGHTPFIGPEEVNPRKLKGPPGRFLRHGGKERLGGAATREGEAKWFGEACGPRGNQIGPGGRDGVAKIGL